MTGWLILMFVLGTGLGTLIGILLASFSLAKMIERGELEKTDKYL